jgi:putative endopeptidase
MNIRASKLYSASVKLAGCVCCLLWSAHGYSAEEKKPETSPPLTPRKGPHAPLYGKWGFDQAGAKLKSKPGDDFFLYANGVWIDRVQIPPDKPAYSLRREMTDRTEQRVRELMEGFASSASRSPQSVEGKVGAFYQSFMNETTIEKLGAAPIREKLEEIKRSTNRATLAAQMGRQNADLEGGIFLVGIDVDIGDPKHYSVILGQADLGLPDRDYYLAPNFSAKIAIYRKYVARLLTLVDWPEAEKRANDIVAFETRVAEASWTKAQQRDTIATYNPLTLNELENLAPNFAWREFLAGAGLDKTERVIVLEKSALPKIAAIFAETPIEVLQAWQAFNVLDHSAPFLSKAFADAYFEMRGKSLSGQAKQQARWKRGVRAVSGVEYDAGDRFGSFGNLGWAVGQLYTAKYFPPESKSKVEELVANLKLAMRARIEKLSWMGDATKAEALKKLDTYQVKIGYPDKARDYSKVEIRNDDLLGNVRRAAAADWAFYVNRLPGAVDRADWTMTPQTNDAYNGNLRDIVFPAGILQPPIFDPAADPAVNYGAIGAIIGHELTHGFDDEGRKIDAEGKLRDWWTAEDAKAFNERTAVLGKQFSQFEPLPGVKVNGDLTMGENIADLGGLAIALDAYRASLNGKPAPVIDGFTGDQRVFLGWAQAWRGKVRDDAVKKQVVSDPHSPRQFRVNGPMRNIDDWYSAFQVMPGDKLYVDPKDRVRIW